MPNAITSTGLTVESQAEIIAALTAGYTTIYGSDINLDSNTPDGQMMNIYATALEDNLELLTTVYNQFSLQNAFGVQVDNLIALNGLQRQAGTSTVTYVQVTVTQAVTLPGQDVLIANPSANVATVSDNAGNQYQLELSHAFAGAGTATLAFVSVNIGQVLVLANTINIIATPLTGWSTANNPSFTTTTPGTVTSGSPIITGIASTSGMTSGMTLTDADSFFPAGTRVLSVDSSSQITATSNATGGAPSTENITVATPLTDQGVNEETDVQCKIRQGKSFSLAATGPADTIRAQLLNTPGVSDAFVPENDTASDVDGVPAHGIWVIVNAPGVADSTIAQVIYSKKTIGCAQKLTSGQSYSITRPAGNIFTAYWDNAVGEVLYIAFKILPINGVDTFNTSQLAQSLATALIYKLNQSAYIGDTIRAMQVIAPNGYLQNVFVGVSPSPALQTVTPATFINYFTVDAVNITITT